MSRRNRTFVICSLIAFVLVAFGVLLLDPFDGVRSFSVVAQEGDGNASPLAVIISRTMFAVMVITAVCLAVWLCFRAVAVRRDAPDGRR